MGNIGMLFGSDVVWRPTKVRIAIGAVVLGFNYTCKSIPQIKKVLRTHSIRLYTHVLSPLCSVNAFDTPKRIVHSTDAE